MAIASLKIKIMPKTADEIEAIKKSVEENLTKLGGKNISFQLEEIAFGLKAIIATFAWPEQMDTEQAENAIRIVEGVSSLDIIDYRRAFG